MIEGVWKSESVKINQINYVNGEIKYTEWNIELHILSKLNNQYITRIVFNNKLNKNQSGYEFMILNYDESENKIHGVDSNSIFNGVLKDDKLYITSTGLEHIKFPKVKFVTSFTAIFSKN